MFDEKNYGFNLGTQQVKISTGKIARQAGGSVIVQCGGTVLLVTATRSKDVKEGQDFFPLTVDYIEKFYASGKFPGGFIKRESKPSTEEILISICRVQLILCKNNANEDKRELALCLSSAAYFMQI